MSDERINNMNIICVIVINKILGNSLFWVGEPNRISEIRNKVALGLAKLVSQDGVSRYSGMWFVCMFKMDGETSIR